MNKYIVLLISILTLNGCGVQNKEKRDVSAVSDRFFDKLKKNDQKGAVQMFSKKAKRAVGPDSLERYLKSVYNEHGAILTHIIAGSVERTTTSLYSADKHVLTQRFNVVYSDGYTSREELSYDLKDKDIKITKYSIKDKDEAWTSADSL